VIGGVTRFIRLDFAAGRRLCCFSVLPFSAPFSRRPAMSAYDPNADENWAFEYTVGSSSGAGWGVYGEIGNEEYRRRQEQLKSQVGRSARRPKPPDPPPPDPDLQVQVTTGAGTGTPGRPDPHPPGPGRPPLAVRIVKRIPMLRAIDDWGTSIDATGWKGRAVCAGIGILVFAAVAGGAAEAAVPGTAALLGSLSPGIAGALAFGIGGGVGWALPSIVGGAVLFLVRLTALIGAAVLAVVALAIAYGAVAALAGLPPFDEPREPPALERKAPQHQSLPRALP
jgi:hypothetical protein